eukprot:Skav217834  [mRNA]  locus=scaffold889:549933:554214:+ [translate_table: standard]
MEIGFWSCTCNDSGSGVLLKQRIPEVALFHGCTLEVWYHNVNGLVTLKENPSIPEFLQQLGTSSLGPSAPAAILRYEASGSSREGIPTKSIVAQVLSLQMLGPTHLTTCIRILSVYSCDAQLEERSDIFSHRFRPTYEPSAATIEETGPDGHKELETPYRCLDTLGARFRSRLATLRSPENLLYRKMEEFIFDLRGQIVLLLGGTQICERPIAGKQHAAYGNAAL